MDKRQIRFYQFKGGRPPFYYFPLMLLLFLVVIGVLAFFGLFVALAVAVGVIILGVLRFITSFGRKKPDQVSQNQDGSTTITLDESDYEIVEKENKSEE